MTPSDTIYVAGHQGLVGSAITRRLQDAGFQNLLLATRSELDLTDQSAVNAFFGRHRPAYVFLAAAKVGGIQANATAPAGFLYENLAIQTNIIHAAYSNNAGKLLFLGSSCIYPKMVPQPIAESALLTGPLEPTNEWYAVAKIAGIKLCQAYRRQYGFRAISLMPTNLYGPGDNFDLNTSHVLPALIRKFHEAKLSGAPFVDIWGTGTPSREFLHVDDLADACLFLMRHYDSEEIINVGTGQDLTIHDLALLVKSITAYPGDIRYDVTKPDGTPRKLLDVSRLTAQGWNAKIPLAEGIAATYRWYLDENRH